MHCFSECEEDLDNLVVFELVVPVGAKVPPPRQHIEIAKLVVRQTAISSTVPSQMPAPLHANNTALSAGWCITATLATPQRPRPGRRC